jgi:hypothetical protein
VVGFFIHKGITSAVMRIEFISDSMLYITLRGHWCDTVLNVHAPTEDKSDDVKDSFYKEMECVFNQFPKNSVRRFQCKSREKIFSIQQSGMRVYMK